MAKSPRRQIVVVTGDVTFDWNLAHSDKSASGGGWTAEAKTRACWQRGGAALLGDLIHHTAHRIGRHVEVRPNEAPKQEIYPSEPQYHRSYAIWKAYGKDGNWRVKEFLGLDRGNSKPSTTVANWQFLDVAADTNEPDIVVLDDANLGFRNLPDYWPMAVQTGSEKTWYVLKMAHPVAQGPLWKKLIETVLDRLIVVMTVNDLRRQEVQISRQLSWERTAQDVFRELTDSRDVQRLSKCAHTVVSFETAGAILVSKTANNGPTARLFFDPKRPEGEWNREYEGMMIGYNTALSAAIVRELILNHDNPDLSSGIQAGIAAMRVLHREGYAKGLDIPNLQFPLDRIAATLTETLREPLAVAEIRNPVNAPQETDRSTAPRRQRPWTILADSHPKGFDQVAEQIVRDGIADASDLKNVPITQLGELFTVDRQEIESLHSIRGLIEEYQRRTSKQPLSIAVFGPPGAGKSFYVKQVAGSVLQDKGKGESLTFNLSQFDSPKDLLGAFNQVRDESIRGRLPLVFWDEFDTSLDGEKGELGWLRYFLAPMQDGTFQQGEITHPIGRCIFVFAGGTSERMDLFEKSLGSEKKRKAAKLPDFLSRLKGYLNILGPNPVNGDSDGDPDYIVRRALLLRVMLNQAAPNLFQMVKSVDTLNIDPGVLNAFLRTSTYRHGARSIESIISMSRLTGKSSFERSSLPAQTQLEVHVNGAEFLANAAQAFSRVKSTVPS
jgi:ATPase family protein associated with various cellular activities (AAA)